MNYDERGSGLGAKINQEEDVYVVKRYHVTPACDNR
jgi:hypothetical protein